MRRSILSVFIILLFLAVCCPGYAEEHPRETIHLSPGDQLILEEIRELRAEIRKEIRELRADIGKINERIDFLWATMVGGFLGVMIFVGGLVFWDRRTTLAPVHDKITELSRREKILEDALKEFAKEEPRLMERLRIAGLL